MDNQKYLEKAAIMFVDGKYRTFIELAADLLKNIEKLEEEKKGLVVPMGEEELFAAIRAVACGGIINGEDHSKCATQLACLPTMITAALVGKVGKPPKENKFKLLRSKIIALMLKGEGIVRKEGGVVPSDLPACIFIGNETLMSRRAMEKICESSEPGEIEYLVQSLNSKSFVDYVNSYIMKSGRTIRRVIKGAEKGPGSADKTKDPIDPDGRGRFG